MTDSDKALHGRSKISSREAAIPAGERILHGTLRLPASPKGAVLFAHGSGSSRFSPRNQAVAAHLQQARFATLLADLLDESEAEDRAKVFDIDLLADRVTAAQAWLAAQPETAQMPIGCFGASTGAAAALKAAARAPQAFAAVVSRGGRPDLADEELPLVVAPTLLIVGGADHVVLKLNRSAFERLRCPKDLVVIPGATHLFEEPGALEQVAQSAAAWFARW